MYNKDNTNNYKSASDVIHQTGVKIHKKNFSKYLNSEQIESINNNILYIHDSEFFDITLNCCSISLRDIFNEGLVVNGVKYKKPTNLFEIFSQLNIFIVNLSNEISGGITLVNFDYELANLIDELNIKFPKYDELYNHIHSFFCQINSSNSRFGNQSAYVTLTIGIVYNENQAIVCKGVLEALLKGCGKNLSFIFPNVIFRIKKGINKSKNDKFNSLYDLSLKTTSSQMNPTYILADSKMNMDINPLHLHIVGCRSRLLKTLNGDNYGVGRTNIGSVSINLVRMALDSKNLDDFYKNLKYQMELSCQILIKKQDILKSISLENSPLLKYNNLLYPFNGNIDDILNEASLAIGFIGCAEMAQILKPNSSIEKEYALINDILSTMKNICEELSKKYNKIVTLIGSSGEKISYYFYQNDKNKNAKIYNSKLKKGYYTNSFHIPVDRLVNIIEKLSLEGKNHELCNGGGISYVEISYNKNNLEGFKDIINLAELRHINYLGFNFQKNVCAECGNSVEGKICDNCKSEKIIKIRRVSGYLGYLNSFSLGKKIEEGLRVKHTDIVKKWYLFVL